MAILALTVTGCAVQPMEPVPELPPDAPEEEHLCEIPQEYLQPTTPTAPPGEAEVLLSLTGQVLQATTAEERRAIEAERRQAFQEQPTHDNLLRVTLVRALTAALPAELEEVRNDLRVLANGREELSNDQRHLAMLALLLVHERMSLGSQIIELQRKIDSLTEIEASLNTEGSTSPETTP